MTTLLSDRRAVPRVTSPESKAFLPALTEIKSVDDAARTFEGYSATWDEDLGDDQIVPGAFAKSIAAFKAGKRSIALIDNHQYNSVLAGYGDLIDAREDERGLWSKWKVIPGLDGDRMLDRLRGGVVRKMSIGYFPIAYEFVTKEREGKEYRVRLLKEIKWEETSLVLFPMNPAADIDLSSIKAMLGQKNLNDEERARLETVRAEIDAVLAGPAADDTPAPTDLDAEKMEALKHRLLKLRIGHLLATRSSGLERVGR